MIQTATKVQQQEVQQQRQRAFAKAQQKSKAKQIKATSSTFHKQINMAQLRQQITQKVQAEMMQ